MELAALWVVLIALGAFVVGAIGGWTLCRRAAHAAAQAATGSALDSEPGRTSGGATVPTDAGSRTPDGSAGPVTDATARPAHTGGGTRTSIQTHGENAEVSAHRLDPADPVDPAASVDDQRTPATQAPGAVTDPDLRTRYAEIIGIETENASLRAVAGRIPGLEQRIRDLEAELERRGPATDQVIDLTDRAAASRSAGADSGP